MANNRTLPFSNMPLPEGEGLKPGPRKDEKTNTALARSFLVDPTILMRQVAETTQADPESGEKKKSNADLQREKLAEQAKAVELARYQARGLNTASSIRGSAPQSPDHRSPASPKTSGAQGTKTRFELDGDTQKSAGMTKVNPLGLSQTAASMMSAQDTQIEKKTRRWETETKEGGALSGRLTETIITEHMDNLSKLKELEEHIKHISETKEKERDDRKKRLQSLHIFERFDDVREQRILTRHEKRQREWDEFRARMVKKLGKEADPDNLVINRAEEWRATLEEKELLVKAKPIEQRQGSNVWQMSLRDAWTRYISVGGPFSGLEMPYIDRPELRPDSIYTIRNPFTHAESYPNEVLVDPRTGQPKINPKTKQPYTRKDIGIAVHPSMNLDKSRKSRATVPGEVPHKDGVKRAYSKALSILHPAEVLFDGLCVEGAGFESRFEYERAEEEARLAEEERQRQIEEEKQRRKQANRGKTRGGVSGAQSDGAASVSGKSATNTAVSAGADLAVEPSKGIEFEPWVPEEEAPLMSFEEDRLVMQTAKGKAGESLLSCMNVGNCAVYYSWSRVQVGVDNAKDALQRFFMKDVSGSILPGKTKEFVFNFKSEKPGVFAEEWTFTGTPNVAGCQHKVLLKGICMAEDFTRAKRAELEARLAASQRDHTVEEIVNEVVEHIGTPRTKPRVLAEDPDVDRQVFIAQNKEAQIYYSNTTLKLFRSLADSTFELLNFPMELRKWDSSLNSLKRLLYAIEDDYERERHIVQFNEIMKNAGIPPTSTAMFNSICYELVSELADSIPDIAEGIRKKLTLPKKNLQPKREEVEGEVEGAEFGKQGKIIMEERVLTYTTELPRPVKDDETGREPPPNRFPQDPMNLWHFDDHLLRIGGPPVEWFYPAGEEKRAPDYFVGTEEETAPGAVREGVIKLKKKISVEMWENEAEAPKEEGTEEGEEDLPEKPSVGAGRDSEDTGRLEFEYLLRLNDAVYYNLATMTERMALLNVEADLRSQVIAQVVIELNDAAAEEIRTLIKEDKVDEARKIDPAKYQNIVDLDQVFRMVMKQETDAEADRIAKEKAKEEALRQEEAEAAAAGAAGGGSEPVFAAGGLNAANPHAN